MIKTAEHPLAPGEPGREAAEGTARDGALAPRYADGPQPALLLAVMSDAVLLYDLDGRVTELNPAAERLFGCDRASALGRTAELFYQPAERGPLHAEIRAAVLERGRWEGEIPFRRADGGAGVAETTVVLQRGAGGAPAALLAVHRDATQRRAFEEHARYSQKMEAVGRLAGGVAHDMNNRLMVISARAQFALDELAPSAPVCAHIEKISEAAALAATLTRQLLAFSRRQVLDPRVLALNDVVATLEPLLCRLLGEHILLTSELAADLWPVWADPGQLEHVLVHLALNAQEAMPAGGCISLATANVMLDEAFAQRCPAVIPGPYVGLSVRDTGIGMDTTTLERAFEPFFTTKELGKGSGLGLSTVYGIVRQSGGVVLADSEPGRGTSIQVFLPRATPHEEPLPPSPAPARGPMPTILLVEDEDQVRMIVRRVLQRAGYPVLEARNGHEALLLAEIHATSIRLLITDMVMPEISGRDLAEQMAARHPGLRVLFVSGHTGDALAAHGVLQDGVMLLTKPFDGPALTRRVHSILGTAATP